MKYLLLIIILFTSCHLKKDGKLVPNTPAILLDKEVIYGEYSAIYRFVFYVDNDAYSVSVKKEFYDRYNIGDTVHGYQVIPNE
jgi:hypothetical protein